VRAFGKLARGVAIAVLLIVGVVAVLVGSIELSCRGPSATAMPAAAKDQPSFVIDAAGYRRDEARTYFTFPEWYIVYVAEDFGKFVETANESRFPYLSAISGFWSSFCTIKRRTFGRADMSANVSVMIYTIGVSFSAEYAIKGAYENTLGRLTEWIRGSELTAEDRFSHFIAQDYAKFLYAIPWYKYPFAGKLEAFWRETPMNGSAPVRKWERRFALSLELAVKSGYGFLIEKALEAADDQDAREIMLVVRGLTEADAAAEPRIKAVKDLGDGARLIVVPRYQVFSDIAVGLSRKGRVIAEIAGNHTILMTAILPDGASPPVAGLSELISMPLSSKPGWRRAGFDVRVDALVNVVQEFDRAQIAIEHLFDY
jgi:hypothetical protein